MTDIDQQAPRDLPVKPFPYIEGGVNENAAIRVIRMVKPECPIDSLPEIRQKDGSLRPNPRYTGEQNCQQLYKLNSQGVWDVQKCIDLGHDPYYIPIRKTLVDDVVVDGLVTEQKVKLVVEKRLNIHPVTDNPRHSSGTEVQLALARGYKFLDDFDCHCTAWPEEHRHEVPCEFRHCLRPQTIQTRWGKYCSERHARLVGADKMSIILPQISGDEVVEQKTQQERDLALSGIPLDARQL